MIETDGEEDIGEKKVEEERSQAETVAPSSGPSGLVIFGRLVQKHSYVSALIIMMVNSIVSPPVMNELCHGDLLLCIAILILVL